ncbi:hypothetical protein Tco_0537560 [Tanacetum coccineum]
MSATKRSSLLARYLSYKKDDYNRRYDGDDSEDIMQTSAALENLYNDMKEVITEISQRVSTLNNEILDDMVATRCQVAVNAIARYYVLTIS